ncbi:MAG: alpha/beta hydrolase [Cyclobacteriaceae bacterium]|nr:alpha/beta hydrolase [Cyclobacteriaceae bacterium]
MAGLSIVCCTNSVFAQPIPTDTSYTVHATYLKLQKTYPTIKAVQPVVFTGVAEYYNLTYKTISDTPFGTRSLHVDVFVPEGAAVKPAILIVHGGGWRSGNKAMNTPMAQHLAHNGFVVFSVEYRLSLEAKYPAALYDLKSCVQWIRENASHYAVDPNKIAIAGSSAGGQLASLLGVTNGRPVFEEKQTTKTSSAVQAVIDIDGLLDFTDAENLAVPHTENSADVFWLEGFYEQQHEKWKQASALTWVSRQSPPFLFINSSQTRFHAGHAQMVNQLNRLKVYHQTVNLSDAPHSFWLFEPWFEPSVQAITEFMNRIFIKSKK